MALSRTPVAIDDALATQLDRTFAPRELVVLAVTIAQVNFWTRFNQGLGVPAAGFFDERVCPLARATLIPQGVERGARARILDHRV